MGNEIQYMVGGQNRNIDFKNNELQIERLKPSKILE